MLKTPLEKIREISRKWVCQQCCSWIHRFRCQLAAIGSSQFNSNKSNEGTKWKCIPNWGKTRLKEKWFPEIYHYRIIITDNTLHLFIIEMYGCLKCNTDMVRVSIADYYYLNVKLAFYSVTIINYLRYSWHCVLSIIELKSLESMMCILYLVSISSDSILLF